jgi:hypothetical protein
VEEMMMTAMTLKMIAMKIRNDHTNNHQEIPYEQLDSEDLLGIQNRADSFYFQWMKFVFQGSESDHNQ